MKTVEEFAKEIIGSAELQKELTEIKDKTSLEEFLKKNDCGATVEEFVKFVQANGEGEIDDNAAGEIAGGGVPFGFPQVPFAVVSGAPVKNFDW